MQIVEYSHHSGKRTLGNNLCQSIRDSLEGVTFKIHRNCSRELRTTVIGVLALNGWSDKVQIDKQRKLTITAMHGRVALCLQTGNMARFYADLLKLQALYLDENISGAFFLVPTLSCSRVMGDNIANYERLTAELSDIFHKVITVPMVVIGFEN